MRYSSKFMKFRETRPAAQTGIAGPTFEACLSELSTRREYSSPLAVYTYFSMTICFAEAMRLTRYVRNSSWRKLAKSSVSHILESYVHMQQPLVTLCMFFVVVFCCCFLCDSIPAPTRSRKPV